MNGRIFSIQRYSIHDGPGIRTTVFMKGCGLRCLWCHNPESQIANIELMFYSDKCVGCGECRRFCEKAFTASCVRCGRCADVCLHNARKRCGYDIDLDKLFAKVLSDRDFYEESGGGVTISGGEPLLQAEFVGNLLKMCRDSGIHTAVETAGFVPFESFEKVLPHTDLFLYDIKCINESLHKRLTGVSNVPILENARRLLSLGKDILFRMPVVPGFNDAEVSAVSEFVGNGRLQLLAYHDIGASKYAATGRPLPTADSRVPADAEMRELASRHTNTFYSD